MTTRARGRSPLRRTALAIVAAATTLALTGCGVGFDLYNTPLPGGADVGDRPITISADFADAVDLVPQSSVKVDNIAVGRVSKITLNPDSNSAHVTLVVNGDVVLPVGTTARLQQTSLLGEKYVALIRPATTEPAGTPATGGRLKTGDTIPIGSTSQIAEVEQVLGALSLVVNGGGVGQFQEISRELQKVSTGRPEEIKQFLRTMNVFVSGLDRRKEAITGALDAMAKLSTTLDTDKAKITQALDGLSPGLKVLADQREELVSMLTALDKLSTASVRTLRASQKDMTEDLKLLEPILRKLAAAGQSLPDSLELLFTYPFPDSVLDAIKGDYFNVYATANYTSLPADCVTFACEWKQIPDDGNMPVIDHLAEILASQSATASPSAATAAPRKQPSAPASGTSGSAAAKPSASSSASGSASPSAGDTPSGAASASPSGSPSASPSGSANTTPSPSLLPPTDSALPGLGQRYVQLPTKEH